MADTVLESIAVNFFANVGPLVDAMTRAQRVTYEYGVSVDRANQIEEQALSIKTKYERSLGDLNEMYRKGMISLQAYNKELERLQGGSISDRMTQGMHAFAGASTRAIGATHDAVSLLRGEFNTVGEEMGKIGGMATMIPGPWGQAIGSVIAVVGQLVDLINRDLIQAQQAAKREFMGIVEGAKQAELSMRHIESGVLREGMERLIRERQNMEQARAAGGLTDLFSTTGAGNVARSMFSFGGAMGAGMSAQEQMEEGGRTRRWMQQQLQMRRANLESLMNDPQLREDRRRLAEVEIGTGLLQRPIEMEEHAARRRMMMQMHRPVTGGPEQQALAERQLAQANERLAVMQLIRRTGRDANGELMTYGAAELALRDQIRVSNAALVQDMRRRRDERMEEHAAQATQKWREEMQKLADVTRVQSMVQSGALPFQIKQLEEQLKVESELRKLRDEGATVLQLAGRRRELETAMNQRLLNDQWKEGNQIANSLATAEEKYEDTLANLNRLLAGGFLSQENFNRALWRAQETYENANESLKELNAQASRGASIVDGYRDPVEKLEDKIRDLASAYVMGKIQIGEYRDAVMHVRAEQDKLNASIGGTKGMLVGSAEAFRATQEYMRSVAPLTNQGPGPWEDVARQIRGNNEADGLGASGGSSAVAAMLRAIRGSGTAGMGTPTPAMAPDIIAAQLGGVLGGTGGIFGRLQARIPRGEQIQQQGFANVRDGIDMTNSWLQLILQVLSDQVEMVPPPVEEPANL